MELVQELLLTVLMAALLSFVLAKLVSVVAAKDVSGETLYSESPAMEEVKFEDRLRAPDVERDDRVQFVEEVTVGKVDHFEPGEFIMLEAEAEKDAVRGEEIGLESCDQLPEATERRPGAGSELKVNVSEDGKNERSDEPMKSPEESSSREVAFEKNLDVSEEIQTEPSGAPMESTELPQKSASDVELNDKREDAEPEKETDQSSTEEATSDQSSTEEVTDDQALAEMETDQSSTEEVKREDAEPVKETDQSSTEEVTADQALAEMETDQSSTEEVKREDAEPEKAAHAPQSQAVAEVHEEMAISEHIDDDDWEGIERSELEKDFAVAADYCGSESVSDDLKMQLYGLHKVATEGPCYEPQPMALKVTARAKWNAWQRLGSMNPDIAMEQYITILSENLPRWKERKSLGSTEADTPTPVSGLNTKSIHQPNTTEDRTGASNASLVHNEAVMKDKSLVVKVEE